MVSGAGCTAGDAVTRWPSTRERQKGMAATEIDYVVVNGTAESHCLCQTSLADICAKSLVVARADVLVGVWGGALRPQQAR